MLAGRIGGLRYGVRFLIGSGEKGEEIRDSRFPHMCRAPLRFSPLSFIPPVPYPPLRGTLPSRGRLAIREYRLLKRRRATLVTPSAPPLRHPERSRGIFLARPSYARMRPHSNDALVLPFIAFLSFTFYRSAQRIPPLRPS